MFIYFTRATLKDSDARARVKKQHRRSQQLISYLFYNDCAIGKRFNQRLACFKVRRINN
jgi:hypothetical protein